MSRHPRKTRISANFYHVVVLFLTAFLASTIVVDSTFSKEPSKPSIMIGDFEGKDYGDWTVEGDAFVTAPVWGYKLGGM